MPLYDPLPERLGRYVLFDELARGGMGVVYLARSRSSRRSLQRIVALKRMHAHLLGDERFRRMFLDEARIVSQLVHPNVVSASDVGDAGGTVFLAMPYVLGESLDRVIVALERAPEAVRARLPVLAARILGDVCEGLHAAHELRDERDELLQVVHRDVTPRNVLVGYDGVARVLDFGVASALHRQHHTATGELKGTASYAAPEHILGQRTDRRADVWSLGVLAWELGTGRRLFAGAHHAEVAEGVLKGAIRGPRELNPVLPLGYDEVALKALNRDPARRYESAREMARELSLLLAEEGQAFGAAEVSDCMAQLFPGGEAEKRRRMHAVRSAELPPEADERRARRRMPPRLVIAAAALGGALVTWLVTRLF